MNSRFEFRRATRALAVLLAICWACPDAQGLNIILNPLPPTSGFPAFDLTGAGLISLFEHVEQVYQDIFEDPHTLTINFWYEPLTDASGDHDLVMQSGGRETEANIKIDPLINGWIDPTPAEDSEFNMQQILWRDLTGTQPTDWYNFSAGVPETFEVGYTGSAVAGGSAAGAKDMLSLIFHEVGHALGMSASNNSTVAETIDGDYDYNPNLIFGSTLGARVLDAAEDSLGHLNNVNALMDPNLGTGLRQLPSHSDIFAMAAGHSYTDLDVPRREFYGNSNWNNASNWSGDKVPGTGDDVFIRDAQGPSVTLTARLFADGVAGSLTVSEGANFDTDAFRLDVTGDVTVRNENSDIFIRPGGELEADEVYVQDDAEIEMSGGILDARFIKIRPAGQLQSVDSGSVSVNVDQLLINNGQLEADGGSSMAFASLADLPWDLDGDNEVQDGIVDASDGNISFVLGGLADPFDGTMRIGAGHVISIFAPWVNSNGTLDLNGGTTFETRARLNGLLSGTISMTGGDLSVTGIAHIDAPAIFFGGIFNPAVTLGTDDTLQLNGDTTISGGTWTLGQGSMVLFEGETTISGGTFNTFSTSSADGRIAFNGDTTYNGGTITVNGVARQEGQATVENATTINADVFDLDGTGVVAGHTWTLNDALIINADNTDVGDNVFNSHITINSTSALVPGKLTINLPGDDEWTIGSTSNLIMTGQQNVFSTTMDGSDFNLEGTAGVTDNVSWEARADVSGAIIVNADSNLRILGGSIDDPYRLNGGVISGLGTLSTIGDRALIGHGTIATGVQFFNEAELRAARGTLVVSGVISDVGVLGTVDASGVLRVTNPWNTSVADVVELKGGALRGAAVTNDRILTGHGAIESASLVNDNTLEADGGTLVVNTTAPVDLDGTAGNGLIRAVTGNLRVRGLAAVTGFAGRAEIGAGHRLVVDSSGLAILPGGVLEFSGGTYEAPVLQQNGILSTSTEPARIAASVTFGQASDNDLQSDLHLAGDAVVFPGASFQGTSDLVVESGSSLQLNSGADLGSVGVVNDGQLLVGNSPGQSSVGSFTQMASGTWTVDIGGTAPATEFDRLLVAGNATLAGTLEVLLEDLGAGVFQPVLGDSFEILSAAGVSGTFADTVMPSLSPGLLWQLDSEAQAIILSVVDFLAGDYNGDDAVNAADYTEWRDNLGSVYTQDDYTTWRLNFGSTIAGGSQTTLAATSSLAIPEPTTFVLLALGFVLCAMRGGWNVAGR